MLTSSSSSKLVSGTCWEIDNSHSKELCEHAKEVSNLIEYCKCHFFVVGPLKTQLVGGGVCVLVELSKRGAIIT